MTATEKPPVWKRAWWVARLLVSAAIVVYLVRLLDWRRFADLMGDAEPLIAVLAPLALLTGYGFGAARWTVLLRGLDIKLGLGQSYLYYIRGLFYGCRET